MADDPAILAKLDEILRTLQAMQSTLAEDRKMMWRILALAIAGAFALIGIKLAIP